MSTTEISGKGNSNSILINIIIILIVVYVLWIIFDNKSESKVDKFGNVVTNEYVSPDGMMGQYSNQDLMAELTNTKNYTDSNASVLSKIQTIADKTNPTLMTPDARTLYEMNKVGKKDAKGTGCNLLGINPNKLSSYKKKYYNMYKHQVECPKNCNLSTSGSQDCYMSKIGMKKCGLNSSDADCGGIFTYDYNNSDVFALGYLALDNNNSKPCVTCTSKPSKNNLDRSSIDMDLSVFNNSPLPPYNPMDADMSSQTNQENIEGFACPYYVNPKNSKKSILGKVAEKTTELGEFVIEKYEELSPDTIAADEQRLFQQNVSNANVSNYVDYNNNTMLNSTSGETQVDKLAEIRTCVSGTCGLDSYGKNIASVYNKLLETPAYTNRASCDPDAITGILEDATMSSGYANT